MSIIYIDSYKVQPSGLVGNLTFLDSDFQVGSGNYRSVCIHNGFICVGSENTGIYTYSVDGSGNLTFIDSSFDAVAGTDYYRVQSDDNFVYVATQSGLLSYSIDGSGNLTYIDTLATATGSGLALSNDFIFIGDGSNTYTCSVDVSGNLTLEQTYPGKGSSLHWTGSYLISKRNGSGISSFSVSGLGVLSFLDSANQSTATVGEVYGGNVSGYVFESARNDEVISYSIDVSGNLSVISSDSIVGADYYYGYEISNILCVSDYDNGLRSYTIDGSGNIVYVEANDQGGYYLDTVSDSTFIYVANATLGLMSYQVT